MASSIPLVKAELVSLWAEALPTVSVKAGSRPPITSVASEGLSVGHVTFTRFFDSMSEASVEERYKIECALVVNKRADQQIVSERAMELYGIAEAAVRLHPEGPSLGLPLTVSAMPVGEGELDELEDETMCHSVVLFNIDVTAHVG